MKSVNKKRVLSFLMVMVFSVSIMSSNIIFNATAATNNNWTVGGTGQNVTISTNGSATSLAFSPSYNWATEWAKLQNKLIPIADKTFSFKFTAVNLAGGWIPFVLCWSPSDNGSLHSNGLFFLLTNGNLELQDTSSSSANTNPAIAQVPMNTAISHIVTVKLIDVAASTVKVSVDGVEVVRYNCPSMASMLALSFPLNDDLQGLSLAVGGGGNTAITFDTNTTLWETVGNVNQLNITGDLNNADLNFSSGDFSTVYAQLPNKFKPISQGLFGFNLDVKSLSEWAVLQVCWSVTNGSPITSNSGVFFVLEKGGATGYQISVKKLVSDAVPALGPFPISLNANYQIKISSDALNNITIHSNNVNLGTYNDASMAGALNLSFPYAGFAGLTFAVAGSGAYDMAVNTSPYAYTGNYKLSTSNILTNINPQTSLANFKNGLTVMQGATVSFSDSNGPILDLNNYAGSGITVSLVIGGDTVASYKMLLYGDINGDGLIGAADIIAMKGHLLKSKLLTGTAFTAADIFVNNSINIRNVLAVKKQVLGFSSISQNP